MVAKKLGDDRTRAPHPNLKVIQERVGERITEANLSQNQASRQAGLGLTYITDLLSGKTKNPSRDALAKLAKIVDCDVKYLLGEQATPRITAGSESASFAAGAPASVSIPLYQIGLTDPDGRFSLNESRKSSITSVFAAGPEVYAVSVPDDTMSPRYQAGEVVIVSPYKPIARSGFAIVRMIDKRVMIREVVSISPEVITVKSLATEAIVELPRKEVETLDRIVGSCELT